MRRKKNCKYLLKIPIVVVVQLLSHVWLFAAPWTAACQASLSFTISWRLLKLLSIELAMMPSNNLILCYPLLLLPSIFPSIKVFSNESTQVFTSGGQIIGGYWKNHSFDYMNLCQPSDVSVFLICCLGLS